MCTGAEIAALAVAAAGTGTSIYAQNQALKRQDQNAARGIRRQSQLSEEADTRVRKQISDTANSNGEADRRSVEGQLLTAIRRQQTPTPETIGAGSASARFAEDVAGSERAGKADVAQLITNLSRVDAPQLQRQREAANLSRTATDLGLIGLRSRGEDFLTRLRAGSIQPNPWLTGLGSAAQGVGTGMAASSRYADDELSPVRVTARRVGAAPVFTRGPR